MKVKEIENNLKDLIDKYRKHLAFIDLSHIDGFFTALCCTKEIIQPARWLPVLWNDKVGEPDWESDDEFNQFLQTVLAYYNLTVALLPKDNYAPAIYERVDGKPDTKFWCWGFLRGADLWDRSVLTSAEKKFVDEHIALIQKISARGYGKEYNSVTQEQAMEIYQTLKSDVQSLFKTLEKRRLKMLDEEMAQRSSPKVGRNDPCPCGSGKKFKQCCLH